MNSSTDIQALVIIGFGAMLTLIVVIFVAFVFNQRKKLKYQQNMQKLKEQQQNQLIEAAIKSEESERHRIAETLHDEVGAILSSAKLHLLGIKQGTLDEKDQKLHEKGSGLLNDVILKVRGISHNLHSNILKEFGLNEAIRHFLKQVTGGNMIQARTELDDNYITVNQEQDISLYRMIQELINNIIKHSKATELVISSTLKDQQLEMVIFHNGSGLTQERFEELSFQKEGLGLKNIRNRVLLLKGTLRFAKEENGYSTSISIPLMQPAHA